MAHYDLFPVLVFEAFKDGIGVVLQRAGEPSDVVVGPVGERSSFTSLPELLSFVLIPSRPSTRYRGLRVRAVELAGEHTSAWTR